VKDEDLIQKYHRDRDNAAFDELDRRFRLRLWVFLQVHFRFRMSDADIEDVVEDALLKALLHAGSFDATKGSVAGWLFTIARRCAFDFCNRRRQPGAANPTLITDDQDVMESVPAPKYDLETVLFVRETLNCLEAEAAILLWLAYAEQLSVMDIASVVELPPTTVRHRLDRARDKFKCLVDAEPDAPELPPSSDKQSGGNGTRPVTGKLRLPFWAGRQKAGNQPARSHLGQLLPDWLVKKRNKS
jgi:RNA polymerase sigma-70 factor (ECF subfamily)